MNNLRHSAIAIACVLSAFAAQAADEMPSAKLIAYMNGGLSLVVESNDFTAVTAGIVQSTDYSRISFEVQVKGEVDEEYRTISGALPKAQATVSVTEQYGKGAFFIWESQESLEPGRYSLRARATATQAGMTTDWRELGSFDVMRAHGGTVLAHPQATDSHRTALTDGSVNTYFEYYTSAAGVESWAGLDFGKVCEVSRIRYVGRSKNGSRAKNAVFQTAEDPEFTQNVQTIYTIPASPADFTLTTVDLTTPVRARYVRVVTKGADCCNFDEVEWIGNHYLDVSTVSLDDTTPTFSWAFMPEDDVVSSELETALSENGPYVTVGDVQDGLGPFAVSDEMALVGQVRYYRIKSVKADESVAYSPVVKNIRFRRLDRVAGAESTLCDGVTLLAAGALSGLEPEVVSGSSLQAFDGKLNTWSDVYTIGGKSVETVVGVRFDEPVHVAQVCAYPRSTYVSRMRTMHIRAAVNAAAFQAKELIELSPANAGVSAVDWYAYPSADSETTVDHVFGWDDAAGGWCGNVAELRIYGWTRADEEAAGMSVAAPQVGRVAYDDATPVVTWAVSRIGHITQATLQYAYQPDGPYADLGEAKTAAGTFTNVHADAKIGLPTYYRVIYQTLEGVRRSDVTLSVRPRLLERESYSSTSVLPDVTILDIDSYISYESPTKLVIEGPSARAFDAKQNNYVDAYLSPGGEIDAVVGVRLPTAAYVSDVWILPRSGGNASRLNKADICAAASDADFASKTVVTLASKIPGSTSGVWNHYASTDLRTAYTHVFAYAVDGAGWSGDMTEMYILGWTDADREAASVLAPDGFAAVPGVTSVALTWSLTANAEEYALERRLVGEDKWTTVVTALAADVSEFEDVGLKPNATYEYRLTATGLSGMMSASSELTFSTKKSGLILLLK